jgi:hypothetical protein
VFTPVNEACELCEAARLTEWFFDDDVCWIAECESCNVPMVVWRAHGADPPDEIKSHLWERLLAVTAEAYDFDPYIDDRLRSIPDHYHAHARPRSGFTGFGRVRRR